MVVLSQRPARALLAARDAGAESATVTLDLNRSESAVTLSPEGVSLPDGQTLTWGQIGEVAERETSCYVVAGGELERVFFFSDTTRRQVGLLPTRAAPTMLLAGFPMHRIKDVDPWEDTKNKIATLAPVSERVLDTATGLGYTAIQAAETALEVVTVEIDPTVLEVCRRNPWSQPLFDNPRVRQEVGNSFDVIQTFPNGHFARIFHDPPTLKLAGELYSLEFYAQCFRVLKRGGKLFHYIGDPDSRHGATVTKGVNRRLRDAGFEKVTPAPAAFGVVAVKSGRG
jgi:uncharacterized protein